MPHDDRTDAEWFDRPDPRTGERGLRFGCTMCGNCCTGPEGYVLVDDDEAAALAARLGMTVQTFLDSHTHETFAGRSLTERVTPFGHDCVFLDRATIPGRAICAVYEDRPGQCRTWPFWPSIVASERAWGRTKRICPGMDHGALVTVEQVRILRDTVRI